MFRDRVVVGRGGAVREHVVLTDTTLAPLVGGRSGSPCSVVRSLGRYISGAPLAFFSVMKCFSPHGNGEYKLTEEVKGFPTETICASCFWAESNENEPELYKVCIPGCVAHLAKNI